VDNGGEGAGGAEEGSQWMARRFPLGRVKAQRFLPSRARRFPLGRAKAQHFLPSRATVLWFLLPGRATKRRGEKNRERGGRNTDAIVSFCRIQQKLSGPRAELLSTRRRNNRSSTRGVRRGSQNLASFKTLDIYIYIYIYN
jgi:hypothetical protein